MLFIETEIPGAYVVQPEMRGDSRGFFARVWCQQEFESHGLVTRVVQANSSFNKLQGTVRGMHFQYEPYAETKLVRCVRGAIFDVIVDLRPASPTFRRWVGFELTEENHLALYVPEGFAHGYQTLADDSEVMYQVSQFYTPGAEGGVRYNDPAFGIEWPLSITAISAKDATWPDFTG